MVTAEANVKPLERVTSSCPNCQHLCFSEFFLWQDVSVRSCPLVIVSGYPRRHAFLSWGPHVYPPSGLPRCNALHQNPYFLFSEPEMRVSSGNPQMPFIAFHSSTERRKKDVIESVVFMSSGLPDEMEVHAIQGSREQKC